MRGRILIAALLVASFYAGTWLGHSNTPRASAADSLSALVSELRGIRGELREIRLALQRGAR